MNCEDQELLRRYAEDRDEEAFAELVRRRIDLVYSSALRQVNGDPGLAGEIAQAVFLDLAGKAACLLNHSSITGWLYTSTRYLAANARRDEHRRRLREERACQMNPTLDPPPPDPAWKEIQAELDEAMHSLSEPDREAVLLRFFEGESLGKIGERLGISESAARMRVSRALEKLRTALQRRGVTATASVLSAALATQAVQAAPTYLASQITAMLAGTAGTLGATLATGSILSAFLTIMISTILFLQPWGAIEIQAEPDQARLLRLDSDAFYISSVDRIGPDALGRVTYRSIPPGRYRVVKGIGPDQQILAEIEARSGQTTRVALD